MKKAYVAGGSGLIGSHLIARLKAEGVYVVAASRHYPMHELEWADEHHIVDLAHPFSLPAMHDFDEVYQLADDVGGLGYIGNIANDWRILDRATRMNLNTISACFQREVPKIFFASSACVYPDLYCQPTNVEYDLIDNAFLKYSPGNTPEWAAYPAQPTNEFGWEKLYAERLYSAFGRATGTQIRIARFGNTYGPYCTWEGERAKAPAAICRKIAQAKYGEPIEIWGTGDQRRSFTYVDDAVEGIMRLMASDYQEPVNIASEHHVSITELVELVSKIAGKIVGINHVYGPIGAHGRTSDNNLVRQVLGWEPSTPLEGGMTKLYEWIKQQVEKEHGAVGNTG